MIRRRLTGLVLFCIGLGMLLVITMPVGMIALAVLLTLLGFYLATARC